MILEHPRTAPFQRLREELTTSEDTSDSESTVRERVIEQLMDYLVEKGAARLCRLLQFAADRFTDS